VILVIFDMQIDARLLRRTLRILFLGESGSGKSMMINMLVNLIAGRSYDSPRLIAIPCTQKFEVHSGVQTFSKVDELNCNIPEFQGLSSENLGGEAASRTTSPNFYLLHDSAANIYYQLIDTPGLGDTKGQAYDELHIQSIAHAILSAQGIDMICIVHNASKERLTESTESTLKKLMEILTENSRNIMAVCLSNSPKTIAPNCVTSLNTMGFPTQQIFRFENSCLVHPQLYRDLSNERFGSVVEEVTEDIAANERTWNQNLRTAQQLLAFAQNLPQFSTLELVNDHIQNQAIEQIIYKLFEEITRLEDSLNPCQKEFDQLQLLLRRMADTGETNGKVKLIKATIKNLQVTQKEKKPMNWMSAQLKKDWDQCGNSSTDFILNSFKNIFVVVSSPIVYSIDLISGNKWREIEDQGYFVWVDVPYEKEMNDWRIVDEAYTAETKINAVQTARSSEEQATNRRNELLAQIDQVKAEILALKQIMRHLVKKLNESRTADLVTPAKLIDEANSEITRLNDLELSLIFKRVNKPYKLRLTGYMHELKRLGVFPGDPNLLTWFEAATEYEDLSNNNASLLRIKSLWSEYKNQERIKLVCRRSQLEASREMFRQAEAVPETALTQSQALRLTNLLKNQIEEQRQSFAQQRAS